MVSSVALPVASRVFQLHESFAKNTAIAANVPFHISIHHHLILRACADWK